MRAFVIQIVSALCMLPGLSAAADSISQETGRVEAPENRNAIGTKRALIICGHPGDDEHRKLYAKTIEKLQKTLSERYGFASKEIQILFGGETTEENGALLSAAHKHSTRENIESEIKTLREKIKPNDTLWVVVLGHAHYDGRRSWLNLSGPDIHELDFGKLFKGLNAREQVFFITTPISGFYIKPLSQKGRIVISATEADLEVNETVFHTALIEVLSELSEKKEYDLDGDGFVSVFELYIAITRNIAAGYVADEFLSTEHAQLDDNGDGRSTELQLDYLTEEQGGRAEEGSKPPKIQPLTDGFLSNSVKLTVVKILEQKAEEKTEKEAENHKGREVVRSKN